MADVLIILVLLALGYFCGTIGQHRHYRSLKIREAQLRGILLFNEKKVPASFSGQRFALVSGSAVISGDYFRQAIAGLKTLFGGRLGSFEAMIDRGRREAILRMKEEARHMGAKAVFNVRLETSNLKSIRSKKNSLACVEILAYGTAIMPQNPATEKAWL
ncbi:MAG: YbjQ family protein [Zoogloeaceae bacterium]|jgi:uncharacterized protein YbjQ (UPF0145 family)|nr:YbjQ family protein [Zoogloeaceae bacterium]